MQADPEAIIKTLAASGYRVTRSRRAVIETLCTATEPIDPAAVLARAKARYPNLGLATVYRTVDMLEEHGLARRVALNGKTCVIVCNDASFHYHLICVRCGVVVEVHDVHSERALEHSAHEHGFALEHAPVEIRGVCQKCR